MTAAIPEDDDFTELRDADFDRMDGVGKGANGTQWFIAKSAGDASGLFSPDFVRDLIAKGDGSEPDGEALRNLTLAATYGWTSEQIDTLTPHQRAMALVHAASVRKAKYDTADRKHMAGHEAMADGSYPIADREDVEDAVRAVGRGNASHDAIRRHIISRARALKASDAIPNNWNADGSLKEGPVAKAEQDMDMDPTAVLAEPDGDAPGDPADPGSPAWEAVDAASARKWTALLVRARNALGALAERENVEAATGDGDDVFAAMDLTHAACCIDEAVGVLARFAVDEQAAADFGAEELAAVGKAMAGFDPAALETLEGFAPVVKAGRTLSAANEAALRTAVDALQKVLAFLPAPTTDDGQPVAKTTKETVVTVETKLTDGEYALSADAARSIPALAAPVAKAKGKPMFVVCDPTGKPVGVCDPDDIMPIADMGGGSTETSGAEQAPGGDSADDGAVIPGTDTVASPAMDDDEDVAKSAAQASTAAALAEVLTPLTEGLAQYAQLADVVKGLQERVEYLAKLPDDRKSPLLNGAGIPGAPVPTGEPDGLAQLRKAADDAPAGPERDAAKAEYAYARIKDLFTPRG